MKKFEEKELSRTAMLVELWKLGKNLRADDQEGASGIGNQKEILKCYKIKAKYPGLVTRLNWASSSSVQEF